MIEDHAFYPNPYTGGTSYFTYRLSAPPRELRIKVFTISGRKVLDLQVDTELFGFHEAVAFDGKDSWDHPLADGVYLYLVEAYDGRILTDRRIGKLVILR